MKVYCAYITGVGGPESCIQMTLIRPFILRWVLLLLFKYFSSSFFFSVLARHANVIPRIGSKSFCATYHENNSLNCARIANVCRMREICEKTQLGRNNWELIGSKSTSQSITRNKPMKSVLTRRAGRYIDPGDHRYSSRVAGAVEIFRGFLNRGWGPISPACDGTGPIGW